MAAITYACEMLLQYISQRNLWPLTIIIPTAPKTTMTTPNERHAPLAAIAIRQVEKNTGASRNAFEQAAALQELGYRVVILAERGKAELIQRAGATFVKLPRWPFKGKFRRFWFNQRVQAWCKRHRPSFLISHGDTISKDVIYMHNCVHLASQRIYGKPLPKGHEVAAIHDHVLSRGGFKRVAVNSRMMAEEFKARYGLTDEQLEISYPGYNSEQFNPVHARQERQSARASLGVNEDDFLVGLITSGNFQKRNVAGFIEIAAHLERLMPGRCRFLVVGKDDAKPYQRQAQSLGLEERFVWQSTVTNVERHYGALDVFVLPAHIEEFGRVALEAMACATPVLLSPWAGAAELLRDDFADLVIDADHGAWADRIAALLQNPEREALGERLAEQATSYSHVEQYRKLKASFEALHTSPSTPAETK